MAIRVFQIAKEYSRTSEEVIDILKEAGVEVLTQTSKLDEHALHTLRARLGKFKLTVVDGDQESQVAQASQERIVEAEKPPKTPKKAARSRKKKEAPKPPPAPRLAVRVIKKHDEPGDEENAGAESSQVEKGGNGEETVEPAATPKLHPRPRKPKLRVNKIEARIHRITEKRQSPSSPGGTKPKSKDSFTSDLPMPADRPNSSKKVEKRVERPLFQGAGRGNYSSGQRPSGAGRPARSAMSQRSWQNPGTIGAAMQPANAPYAKGAQSVMPPRSGGRGKFGPSRPPGGRRKKRKKKNLEQIEKITPVFISRVELPKEELGIIMLSEGVTVKELAEKVNRKAKDVIKRLFEKGIMATLNDVLESDLAIEIAKDFGYLAEIVSFEEDLQIREEDELVSQDTDEGVTEPRAPIVTIMGHVDHGKTTLLDAIRSTKVASGEAGGITQHIGAYAVTCHGKDIVFLDTPGHEAFTKMRARGASITDIVILVVAADDGVKPQTIEAISHAKAAKVPIITCINKIDKPEANPERVKQMLTEHELVVEEFGGDSPSVQVSAKTKEGIDELLEMILLVAELNDYRANPGRKARGTVVEAKLDRGRGPVATIIVQDGTARVGDYFITGQTHGKIRAMYDDLGNKIQVAPPSTPVEILGISEVPAAGDTFQLIDDDSTARKISTFRKQKAREDLLRRQKHASLDQLFSNLKQGDAKELLIIIKADVQGSVEGLAFALHKIKSEKVSLRIVLQGVGNITQTDVLLATAADAIIIGFNVKTEPKALELAEREGIDLRYYDVIYEMVKEIESAMLGLVAPTLEERETGKALVKQVFSVAKQGKIAGCQVESGVVKRDSKVRVLRDGEELFSGRLQTLKRFRDDVNEVKSGFECGIGIQGFSDLEENDMLVFFRLEEVQATKL